MPQQTTFSLRRELSFLLGLAINQLILLLSSDRVRPYDGGISHLLISPSADPSFLPTMPQRPFAVAAVLLLGMRRMDCGFSRRWFW